MATKAKGDITVNSPSFSVLSKNFGSAYALGDGVRRITTITTLTRLRPTNPHPAAVAMCQIHCLTVSPVCTILADHLSLTKPSPPPQHLVPCQHLKILARIHGGIPAQENHHLLHTR